jgi:putative FmdB family regulatory protein
VPLYDYVCSACGRRFEVIHGVHADAPESCPLCGEGPVRKAITAATVHYKGTGWAKKERRAAIKTGASAGGGEEASSEAGSSEAGSPAGEPPGEPGAPKAKPDTSPAVPAPTAGESSKATPKPSGSSSRTPARTSD